MAKAPRIGMHGYPPHSGSAAGHALHERSRRVHVLGGNRAQSVRVQEAALPWASPYGGQRFTRRCTGIWGSAAAKGPPSLAGAALGGPLVGPALGPSPARATLRAGGCLLCPVHISARKLDWAFEVFFTSSF